MLLLLIWATTLVRGQCLREIPHGTDPDRTVFYAYVAWDLYSYSNSENVTRCPDSLSFTVPDDPSDLHLMCRCRFTSSCYCSASCSAGSVTLTYDPSGVDGSALLPGCAPGTTATCTMGGHDTATWNVRGGPDRAVCTLVGVVPVETESPPMGPSDHVEGGDGNKAESSSDDSSDDSAVALGIVFTVLLVIGVGVCICVCVRKCQSQPQGQGQEGQKQEMASSNSGGPPAVVGYPVGPNGSMQPGANHPQAGQPWPYGAEASQGQPPFQPSNDPYHGPPHYAPYQQQYPPTTQPVSYPTAHYQTGQPSSTGVMHAQQPQQPAYGYS
jgi:hypothetical protein